MHVRAVRVEVLREGPRHNQLLSPLTHYLAICDDSPAARLVLPDNYEQASFDRRLAELRYEVAAEDPARLHGVLDQTGTEIGKILGEIPGLPGALYSDRDCGDELIHLRLVLAASELSRLPFELSKVPAGGGASPDQWLLLHRPICLTRRNRSVSPHRCPWGKDPRVLLVSGPDVDEAFDAHLAALQQVFAPWSTCPENRGPKDKADTSPWLTVLRDATLAQVEAAMRSRPTYVHFVAHGSDDFEDEYAGYGVALADETVSGARLASSLASFGDDGERLPTVVTLATCDSAGEPVPIPPDTSVAHALHSRGVPLVVASQFPLSMEGSEEFVKVLYGDLFSGQHPLGSLYKLRLALHARHREFHDWASVTIHEALPDDLDEQLDELAYYQARRAHESALRRIEWLCRKRDEAAADATPWEPPDAGTFDRMVKDVQAAATQLPDKGSFAVEAVGLRAAGWKRLAEVEYRIAEAKTGLANAADGATEPTDAPASFERSARWLTESLDDYCNAVDDLLGSAGEVVNKKVSLHWMLTQVVSTGLLFQPPTERTDDGERTDDEPADAAGQDEEVANPARRFDPSELWTTARLSAEVDVDTQVGETRAWGHVSLTELWLLKLADPGLSDQRLDEARRTALDNARRIVSVMGKNSEHVRNTRRQIQRYIRWWGSEDFNGHMNEWGIGVRDSWRTHDLLGTAQQIVEILRSDEKFDLHPDCLDDPSVATTEAAELSGESTEAPDADG